MKPGSMQRLMRPASIAVVGGELAAEVIRQCDRIGFQGEIWPVNPRRRQMEGRPCFSDVESLPEGPDAAFVAVSREKTIEVIASLAQLGAGGAVCFASGFAEIGPQGAALQERLVQSMGGLAVVGPNCYGLINYLDGVALWPDRHGGERVEQGVGIILQSGNIGISLTMQQRSLSLAYLISVGNQAGIATDEYIEALLEDPRVTAIGLHIEGISDVPAFSRAAIRALEKRIPIVALKSGTSERGKQLALSHTSSMAGEDLLYSALFEKMGVMRVETLPQLIEALKFLSVIGPLPGSKIASISCSGGEAALMADLAEAAGLPMAPLKAEQRKALHAVLGDRVPLNNPLDYHTYIWGDEETQYRCFSAMMLGSQDITLKVLDYPRPEAGDDAFWAATTRAFGKAVRERGAPAVVVSTMPENLPLHARKEILKQGLAPMQGIEECLLAIRGAAMIHERQNSDQKIKPVAGPGRQPADVLMLNEWESKQLLRRHGLPVPRSVVCTAEEAVETARTLGFPVAVKILSEEIIHKSDIGGVALDLPNARAVQRAVRSMRGKSDRFLVEPMAPRPVAELFLGVRRDPVFGLALVIGGGGLLVEFLQDRAAMLFPVQRADIERALARLRIAALLQGYRGKPPADTGALVDAAQKLVRFAEENNPDLVEVDINPIFALPEGQGALVVDATVRISSARTPEPGGLAPG